MGIVSLKHKPRSGILVGPRVKEPSIVLVARDICAIAFKHDGLDVLFVSAYVSPSESIDRRLDLIGNLINRYERVILVGNINAKLSIWRGHVNDARGDRMIDFILQHDWIIQNDKNSPPTFLSSRGTSWIDLLLTKVEVADLELEDNIITSTHRMMTFGINSKRGSPMTIKHNNIKYMYRHDF